MAEPIDFDVRPAPTDTTARQELDRLIETLHDKGLLRLANDLASANQGILEIVVRGLNTPGARNAMQNLSAIGMLLGQIPPGTFYRVGEALREAVAAMAGKPAEDGATAPGVRGAYRLLNDDETWQSLLPLLRAVGTFGKAVARPVPGKPISAFSGKDSDA